MPTIPATPKPRRRRAIRIALAAALILLILAAALPYLASIGPIRNLLLRAVTPGINGTVRAGGARLGWFSPICFGDIEIRSPDGEPVVSIARLEGDRQLWRMIFGSDLGELRVERPRINIVLDRHGSNLSRVFAGRKPDEKKIRHPPNVALAVRLIDGSATVRGADSSRAWTAEPINFAFRLRPSSASADGQPRLEVEPGVVLADTQLTPEVCHDLLKYIAPVLSDVTEASGRFSIAVDRWEFPMADFAGGQGAGRLTIHKLDVGPGPLVRELAASLRVPPHLVTVENSPVTFRLADRRIYHSELTFRLQRLVIRTSGSVGVDDGTLDMVAELAVPEHLLGDWPALAALAKGKLRIPIRGTLDRPKIDGEALAQSLLQSGLEVLGGAGREEQIDLGKLLETVRQRHQERAKRQKNPSDKPGEEPKRPLRGLIRGVLDKAIQGIDSKQHPAESGQKSDQSQPAR